MCCEKPTKERPWVPDPMYSDENGTHHYKLEDVIGTETSVCSETDCTSCS